jgi:pyruvate,water dikinase
MNVRRFDEIGLADTGLAGGKGASLGELRRLGVAVPPGFVVTTTAFADALGALDAGAEIAGLDPGDLTEVGRVSAAVRARIEQAPVPDALHHAVVTAYRELGEGPTPVAVRSSATSEDSAEASFAGLQDTYLWVRGEESVVAHVRRCWASLYSVESVAYRLRRRIPEEQLAMAVVVQRMVDARCAGVMFTRSPLTGDRSVVAVEGCWGLGSALVGGAVTPDRFVVNKVTGEITQRAVSSKSRRHRMHPSGTGVVEEDVPTGFREVVCLTDDEIGVLLAAARRIEDHYGTSQDIEWALADDGLYILQSRPETMWGQRAVAPIAAPKARAFDHVFDLLGGGTLGGGAAPAC